VKKYKYNNNEYELIDNYKDGFDNEEVTNKLAETDYFDYYDYIVGDWSYGKLRLKGFNDSKNKNVKKCNNYNNLSDYIKNECAYDCKWFSLKKINKENNK
jgi:uncharacterized protein YutD